MGTWYRDGEGVDLLPAMRHGREGATIVIMMLSRSSEYKIVVSSSLLASLNFLATMILFSAFLGKEKMYGFNNSVNKNHIEIVGECPIAGISSGLMQRFGKSLVLLGDLFAASLCRVTNSPSLSECSCSCLALQARRGVARHERREKSPQGLRL